jgi:chemotaxis family two-component system response regulator Rcp1
MHADVSLFDQERAMTAVILLVDDNPADVELVREALAGSALLRRLQVVRTGEEALASMRGADDGDGARRPALVLLDLNLPGIDGLGVLTEIRRDPALAHTPVVVLTSSSAPHDVADAYRAGANCFVTKPLGLEQFLSTIRALGDFWLAVARLPDGEEKGRMRERPMRA